jgi:hypothetical protein
MLQIYIHKSFLQRHKQNFFNMLKLPICERTNLKSFIKVLRAYGLDQQRSNNIEGLVESTRLKTQVLANQQKQTLLILSYLPHTIWRDLHGSFKLKASFNPSNADIFFSTIDLPQNEVLSYFFSTILWYPPSEPTPTVAPWRMNGKWSRNKFFWVLVF